VLLENPDMVVPPTMKLKTQSVVGCNGELRMDASESRGGMRPLAIDWSCIDSPCGQSHADSLTRVLEDFRDMSSAIVGAAVMREDVLDDRPFADCVAESNRSSYTFRVKGTNELGISSRMDVQVKYVDFPVPMIVPQTPVSQVVNVSDFVVLAVETLSILEAANGQALVCDSGQIPSRFKWEELGVDEPFPMEATIGGNPGLAKIAPFQLAAGRDYTFRVLAGYTLEEKDLQPNLDIVVSNVFSIKVLPSAPIPFINGAKRVTVGIQCPFQLDSSGSFDPMVPETMTGMLSEDDYDFFWACLDITWTDGAVDFYGNVLGDECPTAVFDPSNSTSSLEFPANTFSPGSVFRFSLRIRRKEISEELSLTSSEAVLEVQFAFKEDAPAPYVTFQALPNKISSISSLTLIAKVPMDVNNATSCQWQELIGWKALDRPTVLPTKKWDPSQPPPLSGRAGDLFQTADSRRRLTDAQHNRRSRKDAKRRRLQSQAQVTGFYHDSSESWDYEYFWTSVPAAEFTAGNVYVFHFVLGDEAGETYGSVSPSLPVNTPPTFGTLDVQPSQGISLQTQFQITHLDWRDADLPLEFSMWSISTLVLGNETWNFDSSGMTFFDYYQQRTGRQLLDWPPDEDETLLSDWRFSAAALFTFSEGSYYLMGRARDVLGIVSAPIVSKIVIHCASIQSEKAAVVNLVDQLSSQSNNPSQLFSVVDRATWSVTAEDGDAAADEPVPAASDALVKGLATVSTLKGVEDTSPEEGTNYVRTLNKATKTESDLSDFAKRGGIDMLYNTSLALNNSAAEDIDYQTSPGVYKVDMKNSTSTDFLSAASNCGKGSGERDIRTKQRGAADTVGNLAAKTLLDAEVTDPVLVDTETIDMHAEAADPTKIDNKAVGFPGVEEAFLLPPDFSKTLENIAAKKNTSSKPSSHLGLVANRWTENPFATESNETVDSNIVALRLVDQEGGGLAVEPGSTAGRIAIFIPWKEDYDIGPLLDDCIVLLYSWDFLNAVFSDPLRRPEDLTFATLRKLKTIEKVCRTSAFELDVANFTRPDGRNLTALVDFLKWDANRRYEFSRQFVLRERDTGWNTTDAGRGTSSDAAGNAQADDDVKEEPFPTETVYGIQISLDHFPQCSYWDEESCRGQQQDATRSFSISVAYNAPVLT